MLSYTSQILSSLSTYKLQSKYTMLYNSEIHLKATCSITTAKTSPTNVHILGDWAYEQNKGIQNLGYEEFCTRQPQKNSCSA